MMLDAVAAFRETGFVMLPGFIDGAQLSELLQRVDHFVADVAPTMPRDQVFYENLDDPTTLKQIQRLADHDEYFRRLLSERLQSVAETLLGDKVVAVNLQYFNKPAGVGRATPPHQDGFYFKLEPCEAVTMWLALDDVDEENGCVRYVRGSHQEGMRDHQRTATLGFSQGIADYGRESDLSREIAMHASPGDLLVHHALTIHRADSNQSESRSRRALGAVYYAERAKQDDAAHQRYQEQLRREMLERGEI